MYFLLELSLDHQGVLVVFVVAWLLIPIRYNVLILLDVNCHEVATLTFGRLELDVSRLG